MTTDFPPGEIFSQINVRFCFFLPIYVRGVEGETKQTGSDVTLESTQTF